MIIMMIMITRLRSANTEYPDISREDGYILDIKCEFPGLWLAKTRRSWFWLARVIISPGQGLGNQILMLQSLPERKLDSGEISSGTTSTWETTCFSSVRCGPTPPCTTWPGDTTWASCLQSLYPSKLGKMIAGKLSYPRYLDIMTGDFPNFSQ